ncbi:unnamed protein product [Rotaria sp. Silwood1]|nr:unnamed protein product [Rotaria sp. Silwood1]
MLWNILLLALSWSLGQGIFFIQISITTLAATSFINWYLATIPIGSMLLVATIWSVFLPRVIARYGYRPPFYFGALMGMIGAGLCIVAAWFKLYWLLVVSAAFIDGQVPCTFYYRLAGLQFSTQKFASKAIAMVTAGGCLSPFFGPEIAKLMINVLPKQYSGAYLAALGGCAALLFTMRIIRFPDVKKKHNAIESTSLPTTMDRNLSSSGRSIFKIVGQRTFVIAALGGFVSWSAMGIQMSAAALAMIGSGHTFPQAITAVEYHILGMFIPSFFTGTLYSLQLLINLNDFHKQQEIKNDQTHVIEQFYPYASILGPQLFLPYLSDNQKRLFMELDFAEEQSIEDYNKQDQRENVKQQINKYSDIIEKEFKIQQIIEQSSCEKRLSPQTSEEDKTRIIGYLKVSDLIKNVLNDQKYHQELIKSTHKQITNEINIDSEKQEIFHNLNSQFYKYKNYLNQIQKHEYFEIQPIFRTLDIDLQLIGQILNESNKIQKNLLNITTARYHSNHLNFLLNAKLKYLSVDYSGNLIEQS